VTLRKVIGWMVGLALGLPLGQAVLVWVGGLLSAMGDANAAYVLARINVALGVLWLAGLVGLVVALGLKAALEPPGDDKMGE
jgi:hypothetical protein